MIGRLRTVVLSALVSGFGPLGVDAQMCETGMISEIRFDRLKPFGSDATSEESRAGWLFRGMNAVHVRTMPTVVRWELLFEEGDCLDPDLLDASARSLRSLQYISEATITSERLADGSYRVDVRTVDAWAVAIAAQFAVDQGFRFTGVSGNARSVLGTGTQVALFRSVYRERRRVGLLGRQPNIFGTRVDGTLHGGRTRSGKYFTQSFFRPFAGEVGVNAFRQGAHARDEYFPYSVDPSLGFTQVYRRYEAEAYEMTYQRRFGDEEGAKYVAGIGVSREVIRFPFGIDGIRIVAGNDFDSPTAAPQEVIDAVQTQSWAHETNRVNFTFGFRNLDFLKVIGFDAIRATQDIIEGGDLVFTFAPGLPVGSDNVSDVLVGIRGTVAARGVRSYTQIDADFRARNVTTDLAGGPEGWRDILYEIEVNGYLQQSGGKSLFGRLQLAGGDNMDRPFQLTVGGRESVRAYNEDAYPGGRRILATLEERIPLGGLSTGFADVGVAFFGDVGRAWAQDTPFGEDSGWKGGVGAGIRMSLPAGAPNVLRIDVGFPVNGEREAKGVVFRVYSELFGILDRRGWPSQIQRSRWYGIDPDLSTRTNNPLAGN